MPRVRTLRRVPAKSRALPGRGQLVEDLGGDQGQVVAGAAPGAGAERAGSLGVAVPVEPAAGAGLRDLEQLHRRLRGRRHGEALDGAAQLRSGPLPGSTGSREATA